MEWLAIGDLRSDGQANEVAAMVLAQPAIFPDLIEALINGNNIVRGHAADALEKVSRDMPELFVPQLDSFIQVARSDDGSTVRFHMAMLFGNLAYEQTLAEKLVPLLLDMVEDESPFVKSWVISSLLIWGRLYPEWQPKILESLILLREDTSIAVRHRADKAIRLLLNEAFPLPPGWVKSKRVFASHD